MLQPNPSLPLLNSYMYMYVSLILSYFLKHMYRYNVLTNTLHKGMYLSSETVIYMYMCSAGSGSRRGHLRRGVITDERRTHYGEY